MGKKQQNKYQEKKKKQQMMGMIKDEMPRIMSGIDGQITTAKAVGNMQEVRELQALRAELAQVDTDSIFDRLVFDLATFTLPEASIVDNGAYNRPPFLIWPKTDAHLECCLAEAEDVAGAAQANGPAYDPCGCGPMPGPTPDPTFDLKACGFINWYLKFCLNTTFIGKYDSCGDTNYLPFTATGTTSVDNILCRDVADLERCPEEDLCKVRSIAIRCKTCPLAQNLVDNKLVVTYLVIFVLPQCDPAADNGVQ